MVRDELRVRLSAPTRRSRAAASNSWRSTRGARGRRRPRQLEGDSAVSAFGAIYQGIDLTSRRRSIEAARATLEHTARCSRRRPNRARRPPD
jgi:hypothetical protein